MTQEHRSTGYVKWPDPKDGWRDDGQGGMVVYVLVKYPERGAVYPWENQWRHSPEIDLDRFINFNAKYDESDPPYTVPYALAVVPLGASNYSWWKYSNPEDMAHSGCEPFVVTENDLTDEGLALFNALKVLYRGLSVEPATHIDT